MHRESNTFEPHTHDDDNRQFFALDDDGDDNGDLFVHDGDILADVFSGLNRMKPDEITKSNLDLKQAQNKERGGILIEPHGSESGDDFGFKTNLQKQNPVVGGINLLFDEDNTDPLSMYV